MPAQPPYQQPYTYPASTAAPLRTDSPYHHHASVSPPPPPPKPNFARGTPPAGAQYQYAQDQPGSRWSQHAQDPEVYHQSQQPGLEAEQRIPPPEEGWLPDVVLDKSKPDLQELLQNAELLKALIHAPETAHPSLTASLRPLKAALAENQRLATHLKALHGQLQHTHDTASTRLLSVRGLEQAWKKKQEELDARLEAYGPRALHSRLVASIGEQEATCRGLEDSVIDGDGRDRLSEREVADWIRRVREARKTLWLRKERRERWDEGRVGGWR